MGGFFSLESEVPKFRIVTFRDGNILILASSKVFIMLCSANQQAIVAKMTYIRTGDVVNLTIWGGKKPRKEIEPIIKFYVLAAPCFQNFFDGVLLFCEKTFERGV